MYSEQQLIEESKTLEQCPFCACVAKFSTNKSENLLLEHFPDSGVNCPARCSQICDSFDDGKRLWNTRPEVSSYTWFIDLKKFVTKHDLEGNERSFLFYLKRLFTKNKQNVEKNNISDTMKENKGKL